MYYSKISFCFNFVEKFSFRYFTKYVFMRDITYITMAFFDRHRNDCNFHSISALLPVVRGTSIQYNAIDWLYMFLYSLSVILAMLKVTMTLPQSTLDMQAEILPI